MKALSLAFDHLGVEDNRGSQFVAIWESRLIQNQGKYKMRKLAFILSGMVAMIMFAGAASADQMGFHPPDDGGQPVDTLPTPAPPPPGKIPAPGPAPIPAPIPPEDALGARVGANSSRIDSNTSRIDQNEQAIKDSLALSLAIPSDYVSPGKTGSIAGGVGFTDGAEALGITASIRFNPEITAYMGGSTLLDSDTGGNDWAAKAGVRYEW